MGVSRCRQRKTDNWAGCSSKYFGSKENSDFSHNYLTTPLYSTMEDWMFGKEDMITWKDFSMSGGKTRDR